MKQNKKNRLNQKYKNEVSTLLNSNPILKLLKDRTDKDNLCDPPITNEQFFNILVDYLLGESWHVVMPETQNQVNFAALTTILNNYSKRYRKEINKYFKIKKKLDKLNPGSYKKPWNI